MHFKQNDVRLGRRELRVIEESRMQKRVENGRTERRFVEESRVE